MTVSPSQGIGPAATKETDDDRDRIRHPHNSRRLRGQLKFLPVCADIDIVPNREKSGNASPDFRIFIQGVQVGSGQILTGESRGTDYVSLSLAAPGLGGRKLCANLGRMVGLGGDGGFFLIWNPVDKVRMLGSRALRGALSCLPETKF